MISNKERKWGKTMLRKIKRIDIVYDEASGYWYNKNGQLYATAQQLEIIDGERSYENYITGYKTAALGYEVVGEYYIVRQDGSCFE